ncbi:class II fructose-bisphosphate aldolase family protein [Jatrophihabitans telluris]|uniref:Class II fructose-bisphosphate aldolase family protein n=1 Tax=Jatrophihabitans telluris TaxID=2038343 RepID=A0ABY4QZH1_9ACTN|nr:class II fructose-bisphosphate aldolase [Jatrophihabitans telluris]UQX88239.1 class II fructose-bisphosphate aldolase family protein [Jatrophihabitans telluris]
MPLARTADLVAAAAQARVGVPAFNVITLEHAEAIVTGAERAGVAVILQISQNAVRFHGNRVLPIARGAAAVAESAAVEVSLHLDHVDDVELLHQAARAGFSSAMFDAGAQPYQHNLDATRRAADWAHAQGLYLEAELGYVGGKPDAPASAHAAGVRTDPLEARAFVAATGVDALAVAVGSSHAMTTRSASLDLELIAELADSLAVPLVLHGSSGVPDSEIRHAVEAGIAKVNIGTALNIAMTAAVRSALAGDAALVDPRKYLSPAREAIADTVAALATVVANR